MRAQRRQLAGAGRKVWHFRRDMLTGGESRGADRRRGRACAAA